MIVIACARGVSERGGGGGSPPSFASPGLVYSSSPTLIDSTHTHSSRALSLSHGGRIASRSHISFSPLHIAWQFFLCGIFLFLFQ